MSMDRLHDLLAAYTGRNCTAEEIQELNDLLQDDWTRIRLDLQVPGIDWERMYKEIRSFRQTELTPVRRLNSRWWYVAAGILLLAIGMAIVVPLTNSKRSITIVKSQNDVAPGGNKAVLTLANGRQIVLDSAHTGILAQQGNVRIMLTDSGKLAYTIIHGKPAEVVYNVLTTPRGGQYKIQLPDGTDVWLNSASSIRYPTGFISGERKVEITGEVYFEVAKDKARPFHVAVRDMDVAVLGTHFNINSYADEGAIKTTLLEGKIAVALSANGRQNAILSPGQQALVEQQDRIRVVYDPNLEQVMAWKNGYFGFDHADLITVLRQLERWYDIDVKYAGRAPVRHFNGELSRDLTLSQVISVLSEMDVKFRIEGRTLTVMP